MNYSKINVIGLGYKNFVFKKNLYMLLGDANYILIPILDNIKIICKKNQIYVLSLDKQLVSNFSKKIMLLKKINPYKGKGLIQFKNFKFMKLKTGKKQRFM